VFSADGGIVLFPERQLVRVPDVAFVRAERILPLEDRAGFTRFAPDIAVEVLSPNDRLGEVDAKVRMYLDAGVRHSWVVDPRMRSVAVYALGRPVVHLGENDDLDGGDVLPEFRVPVRELFAPFTVA
jgi:Uma2 family endonuclease